MTVSIHPLPLAYRDLPPRLRPQPAPIFDSDPTPADLELAHALFRELDQESQAWYLRESTIFHGLHSEPTRMKRKGERNAQHPGKRNAGI